MNDGWISLHRGWRDNPIFRGEFSRADAWIWLIENACWKPARTRIKNQTVELQRGELSFAQRFMAEKWGWSKSRVDRFIADLRDEGMIETRSKIGATTDHNAGQGQAIITICNYVKYQDVAGGKWGNDSAEIGATAGQQRGKEEQGNKGTSKKPVANATGRAPKIPMSADWKPGPLPPEYAELVAQWPEGREAREIIEFRDYWIEEKTKRPGWDRTWRSRINDRHGRIMREAGNGRSQNIQADKRNGIARALDKRLGLGEPAGEAGRPATGDGQGHRDGTLALAPPVR